MYLAFGPFGPIGLHLGMYKLWSHPYLHFVARSEGCLEWDEDCHLCGTYIHPYLDSMRAQAAISMQVAPQRKDPNGQ
jgi:hypothetical protein